MPDLYSVGHPCHVCCSRVPDLYSVGHPCHVCCSTVPDLHIEGTLQAIHVMLDKPQLELIKGLIEMNLGEDIEDFEKPSTVIRDPIAQVWK